jgi:protein TonB
LSSRHNNKEIAMHFSHINAASGTKVTKIAVVALIHVVLAFLLIKSMNAKMISIPKMPEDIVLLFTPEPPPPPPPPPEPPKPMPKVAPPQIVAPPPEVAVTQPPPPDTVTAAVTADPAPSQPTASVQSEAPASPDSGAMRTAVLADANGCAKPDYPVRAARNGESGTVTLALLVGTDGRVANSRVQNSSGSRELDKAAVSALSLCKFKPAMNGGAAEQAWAQLAYVWKLDQ